MLAALLPAAVVGAPSRTDQGNPVRIAVADLVMRVAGGVVPRHRVPQPREPCDYAACAADAVNTEYMAARSCDARSRSMEAGSRSSREMRARAFR